jgi:hypothetical protein
MFTRNYLGSAGAPVNSLGRKFRIEYNLNIVYLLQCAMHGGGVCAQRFWIKMKIKVLPGSRDLA